MKWENPSLEVAQDDIERITRRKEGTLAREKKTPLPGPTTYDPDHGARCSIAREIATTPVLYAHCLKSKSSRFKKPREMLDRVYDNTLSIATRVERSNLSYSGMRDSPVTKRRDAPGDAGRHGAGSPGSAGRESPATPGPGNRSPSPMLSPAAVGGVASALSPQADLPYGARGHIDPELLERPKTREDAMYQRIARRMYLAGAERPSAAFSNYDRFRKQPAPPYTRDLAPGEYEPVMPTAAEAWKAQIEKRRAKPEVRVSDFSIRLRRKAGVYGAVHKRDVELEARRGPGMYGIQDTLKTEADNLQKFRQYPRFPADNKSAAHQLTAPVKLMELDAKEWDKSVYLDSVLPRDPFKAPEDHIMVLNTDTGPRASIETEIRKSRTKWAEFHNSEPRLSALDAPMKYYPKSFSPAQQFHIGPGYYEPAATEEWKALHSRTETRWITDAIAEFGNRTPRADPRVYSDKYNNLGGARHATQIASVNEEDQILDAMRRPHTSPAEQRALATFRRTGTFRLKIPKTKLKAVMAFRAASRAMTPNLSGVASSSSSVDTRGGARAV